MGWLSSLFNVFTGGGGGGVADAIDWGSDIGMASGAADVAAGAGTLNDYWDWGSAAASGGDFIGDLAQEYAYGGSDVGNLAMQYAGGGPSAGVYGLNLSDMDAAQFGTAADYVAPEVTAQAGVDATMTPNERAARLASAQRTADGMGGQRLGAGVSNSTGSAWDRFAAKGTTALKDPMTYARLGLALAGGAGQAPVSPRNTQAGYNAYVAEDAAARAENAGLRTQQNNTTRNLQESAGPDAYRAGVTRSANQTEALRKQLGYTNAPTFVKDALVAKQNAQGQLGAQTAYTSAQAAANKSANYLMAPGGNMGLVTAGMNLDRANLDAQTARQRQYAPIGSALESVFGTAEEDARRKAAQEQ